ncbi:MAG: hypothetical protein ACSHWQ_01485 [Spongiibacteraceae bacterium]
MPVKLLPDSAYRGVEAADPDEVGRSYGTHVASVKFEEGVISPAYVKFCGPKERPLFNEVLGYLLAHHLEIRQPRFGAVIIVPVEKLRKTTNLVPNWVPRQKNYPAWCTEVVQAKSLNIQYNLCAQKMVDKYFEIFKSSKSWYSSVAAFDEWVMNTDRNAGNILQLSPKVFSIIDHGRLDETTWHWFTGLNKSNILRQAVEDRGEPHRTELHNAMALHAERHHEVITSVLPDIESWIDRFDTIDKSATRDALTARSTPNWLKDELRVI